MTDSSVEAVADAHKDCENFSLPSERALRTACHLADCQWTVINMMRQKGTIEPGFVRAIYAFARYIDQATPSPEREPMREALRQEIINSPETADFMAGVPIEAAHQRERWGSDHDAGKTPFDWFWLVGYLAQKAATAAVAGDPEKAKHHTISTAAALANWHGALKGETNMRPGIGPMNGGEKPGSAFDLASKLAPPPAQSGDRT